MIISDDELHKKNYEREFFLSDQHIFETDQLKVPELFTGYYDFSDMGVFYPSHFPIHNPLIALKTLDELLEHDKQREKDGFPKRIRLGKLVKPVKGKKGQIIVVPTTYEPKFYHDNSTTKEEESGGTGNGEEGEVIGEQPVNPQEGEGEGQGAGQGKGGEHDVTSEAFDLGKMLTEKFELPNIKNKGKKPSLTKYKYDLTDKHRGFGQLLDKKATIKRIIETNILLGKIKRNEDFSPDDLVINPQDQVFRIMSKEKDYEAQAIVFFMRDYSGSMHGKPTEVVTSQHLLIYSWLMYQYQNNVETRFIVHDTEAKEVPDFYAYYKYQVAGGTQVYPAFELANNIVEKENLSKDYNIYIFYGTDGDDWEQNGTKMIAALKDMLNYANRVGILVAKNQWSSTNTKTIVERNIQRSGLLNDKKDLIRLDTLRAVDATEDQIIESIKKLVSE